MKGNSHTGQGVEAIASAVGLVRAFQTLTR